MSRKFLRWLTFTGILTTAVLALSGRWMDPWLWAYITTFSLFAAYGMFSIDEDLARERFHPPTPAPTVCFSGPSGSWRWPI